MGLGFVKIGVDAVVCEEGVVGSVFGDAAVVEDGGRLVEDDERGVFVEGAGDGGALGLAAGEVDTGAVVVVKAGADALRELLYTVGETDFCKRGLQSSFINRSPWRCFRRAEGRTGGNPGKPRRRPGCTLCNCICGCRCRLR